ncbi:trypsin-like peptidase domain-containing protein [Yimella sp. NH-Cas1]|uniref:S1C family serine protease n=1 Tax=Yimella sp. NH-Cas1 TaxID=2917726 RepID=UPI001EFAE400|nr:trypsin-like peptidase domain-containing protein [Yimella sp. NH-Cas1]MCG8656010.1 trypsin-like peptidase domain-containing protein [Yimella sp. NH-Cas1]
MIASAALLALLCGGVGGYVGSELAGRQDSSSADVAAGNVEAIANKALPSVVTIRISSSSGVPRGSGSGFVLRSDGYIVTNNHVASAGGDGAGLKVLFSDQSEADARIVGVSPTYDLAVLKVERKDLPALELGESDDLKVGQSVIAVGAPLGLTGSVTTGIVSALNRPVVTGDDDSSGGASSESNSRSYMNAIQTDAAINQGNSGGPLLDLRGKVIGVNSAIYSSRSGGSIGLGFAIPADQVRRTSDQLIRTGKAEYPVIGLDFDPGYSGDGVKVSKVNPDGPAAKAGVKEGDVITSIDGVATKDPKTFLVTLRSKEIGDTITVGFKTGEEQKSVTMRTGAGS